MESLACRSTQDADALSLWLRNRTNTTLKAYSRELAQFSEFLHYKPLADITALDVANYLDQFKAHATASQARKTAILKSLFTFLVKSGYLKFNPAAVIKSPKVTAVLAERILSPEEVNRLIECADGPSKTILKLLYLAGLRIDEVLSLTWERVHMAHYVTVIGKGSKVRTVFLPQGIFQDLSSQVTTLPGNYVFRTRTGKPWDQPRVWRMIKQASLKAGLSDKISSHWLRHSHATHALENGASLPLIQNTLGHSNLATTGKYQHIRPKESSAFYIKLGVTEVDHEPKQSS